MNPVDKLKLGIGLAELDLQTEVCAYAPAFGLYVRQCLTAIDFGLAAAEQVQIGTIQDVDNRPHFVVGKISGALCEMSTTASGTTRSVIGISSTLWPSAVK